MSKASQYLTFGIDNEVFALPVERVREVLELRPLSRLPKAPDFVLGLIDVRGESLVVADLRLRFGFPAAPPTDRTRIIVVQAHVGGAPLSLGLKADCVFAVSDLDGAALEPPPTIGRRWRAEYVVGVGRDRGRFVVALDLDGLIEGGWSAADLAA
jgi:purine-binding chemotaxis protein CheW